MKRLKDWRLRRALSQRDLAARSGVATATISHLEQGDRLAYPTTARKLAAALEVAPEELYGDGDAD